MSRERIHALVDRFRHEVAASKLGRPRPWSRDPDLGRELLQSMLRARYLDRAAHDLRATGHGHYTITSSGHENNVVLGRLTRISDPTIVHYRSAALFVERSRQAASVDAVRDICLSLVASREEPLAGGRHKVFGSKALGIMPQTSTIASHLPRAIGMAFALERRPRLDLPDIAPFDAITVVGFGDASLNHSTALGSLNAASWVAHQRLKLPILFICEDNGLGVSVRTPFGWTEARLTSLPHIQYFRAGPSLEEAYAAAEEAIAYCRRTRLPATLHLECVRLLGHAGSDVDTSYRTQDEIMGAIESDPVLLAALDLLAAGALRSEEILELDREVEQEVERAKQYALGTRPLSSRAEVLSTLARPIPRVARNTDLGSNGEHQTLRGLTLAQGINQALRDALDRYPETVIFGEDVAKKGGVYGISKGLLSYAGPARVFNTLLDEQTILGLALGCSSLGLLPIPEIQYLAYLHNAEDQLRGEAVTLPFFSNGAYDNPMVVRIAGLGYQKGFGGHFHNDNAIAVLRDLPGLIVAVPSRADDAFELYSRAFELALVDRRVVVIIEPIALYHQRSLYSDQDDGWLAPVSRASAAFGATRVYHPDARDLLIVTYGNGLYMSLRARERLRTEQGINARVLDLRWLVPLPLDDVLDHAKDIGRVLVVDECRESAGVHEAVTAHILESMERTESGARVVAAHVASSDCFVPLGDAARLVLLSEEEIIEAALILSGAASLFGSAAR